MPNPYPATFEDPTGTRDVLIGEINFDDPDNQPTSLATLLMTVGQSGWGGNDLAAAFAAPLDGVAHSGVLAGSVVSPIAHYGAGVTILDTGSITAILAAIPDSDDAIDVALFVSIGNGAGTQQATYTKSVVIPPHTPSAIPDWNGGSFQLLVGTDLTATDTALATTAGGAFGYSVTLLSQYD